MKHICIAALFLALVSGCSNPATYVKLPIPDPEKPVVSVPKQMHIRNWVDRRNGQGSCVHASSLHLFQWMGMPDSFVQKWKRTHAGGETARSIQEHYRRAGLTWTCTERGDPAFLEWVSESRRGAIIWWLPAHCCCFVGYHEHPVHGTLACIWDNNRPGQYSYFKKEEFLRAWRNKYGGFACTVLINSPATPLPWPIFKPIES